MASTLRLFGTQSGSMSLHTRPIPPHHRLFSRNRTGHGDPRAALSVQRGDIRPGRGQGPRYHLPGGGDGQGGQQGPIALRACARKGPVTPRPAWTWLWSRFGSGSPPRMRCAAGICQGPGRSVSRPPPASPQGWPRASRPGQARATRICGAAGMSAGFFPW
jgi:hypothetical protein